ncbi:transposase [Streptomyces sp. SID2955]|nr:transposase [Streptomyces sp. SID2955]
MPAELLLGEGRHPDADRIEGERLEAGEGSGDGTAGNRHRIARREIDSSPRLRRHRWVRERTVSRLAGCRHLHRRYERKAERFLALVGIAALLVGHRRLDRLGARTDR